MTSGVPALPSSRDEETSARCKTYLSPRGTLVQDSFVADQVYTAVRDGAANAPVAPVSLRAVHWDTPKSQDSRPSGWAAPSGCALTVTALLQSLSGRNTPPIAL